jgi:hypothetical protein
VDDAGQEVEFGFHGVLLDGRSSSLSDLGPTAKRVGQRVSPLFGAGRAKDALWAHAINPYPMWVNGGICPTSANPKQLCWDTIIYGHAPHDLRMIAIPWLDIGLAARLPDQAGSSQLKDMDTSSAWLGDTSTRKIASEATFTGDKLKACWFPNQTFANLWAEYMAKGTIKDSTPVPPAPYNLTGTYSNKQITLKWDADADLGTGIKTFIVYRNGLLLQTIQWPNAPTTLFTAEKGFQRWDDGDQPDPIPAPAMIFTDANVNDTGTYVYQVSTVNRADMTGPKSAPIALKQGLVTAAKTLSQTAAAAVSHTSIFLCGTIDKRVPDLSPGRVDVYDVRGRLVATLNVRRQAKERVAGLLGVSADKVLIVRNRTQ